MFLLSLLLSCKATDVAIPTTSLSDYLRGWEIIGTADWELDKGVLTGSDGEGYFVTTQAYDDVILEAEFHPDATINSGIFIRCPEGEQSATGCYEINIWDNHVNQEYRTGSIVTHGKPLKHINSVGKWNQYKIKAKGNRIQVWLNGKKTADLRDTKTSGGYIALQVNGQGIIKFRNVKIRAI